jgi:hypothetical protein
LFATSAITFYEMLLVVLTHFRRETGDVIPPAGENLTYNSIDTCLGHIA